VAQALTLAEKLISRQKESLALSKVNVRITNVVGIEDKASIEQDSEAA
jgi:hypothetical protein